MAPHSIGRRAFTIGAAAASGLALTRPAWAKGSVTSAIYPGSWDEAYRGIVAPALKKAPDIAESEA